MPEFLSFAERIDYVQLIEYFSILILSVGVIQNFTYLVQVPLAALGLIRQKLREYGGQPEQLLTSNIAPAISIIIPAYNEGITIVNSVHAVLSLQYPKFEVIVVNDGSRDDTLAQLVNSFEMTPSSRFFEEELDHEEVRQIYTSRKYYNVIVVDKKNGGRSDAVNAGVDISRNPIFCTLDADSLLETGSLLKVIQPFIDDPARVMATGGTVSILNGCVVKNGVVQEVRLPRKLLPLLQVMEYIRAFLIGRIAWSHLGILTIISGAFAVFRRDIVVSAGGLDSKTIGEDFELVMRVHRYCRANRIDYKMQFIPDAVCWTESPESLRVLKSQRMRWQQGAMEVFRNHRTMLLNPRYGRIGMVAYPLIFVLDILSPIVEALGLIFFPVLFFYDVIQYEQFMAFLSLYFFLGVFVSVSSLILYQMSINRHPGLSQYVALFLVAILENFGYRQLNNYWRIAGVVRHFRKVQSWGDMTRVGTVQYSRGNEKRRRRAG